jgi:predicted nucleotidyltransferase
MKPDSVKTKKKQELTDELIFSILQKHADVLKKLSVRKIGLFGSFVRGAQKRRSDIDFIVDFDASSFGENFNGYFDAYMDLSNFLGKIFHKKVDLLTSEMISPYIKPYVSKEVKYLETV